jgi:hypothetical protein
MEKRCLIEELCGGSALCVAQNREGDEVAEVEKKETRKYLFMGGSQIVLKRIRKEVLGNGEDPDVGGWGEVDR